MPNSDDQYYPEWIAQLRDEVFDKEQKINELNDIISDMEDESKLSDVAFGKMVDERDNFRNQTDELKNMLNIIFEAASVGDGALFNAVMQCKNNYLSKKENDND